MNLTGDIFLEEGANNAIAAPTQLRIDPQTNDIIGSASTRSGQVEIFAENPSGLNFVGSVVIPGNAGTFTLTRNAMVYIPVASDIVRATISDAGGNTSEYSAAAD